MDCSKVGELILRLRKENGMTQKNIADRLNISDKTVSKWERGLGCPDVSLLNELSSILGVNIDKILMGNLDQNDTDGGNMRRIKFYVCTECGNVLTGTGSAEISCCGRKLKALEPQIENEDHKIDVQEIDNEYYITINHEMSKSHYIAFIAYVGYDRVLLVRLYPEQNAEIRLPRMMRGRVYAYCNQHGLWMKEK